ncbi:hypothetical protein D3C85_1768220 [compost metagenome]
MVAVPEAIPETNPVAESTVATKASLVLHEPPATVEANVVVPLAQIFCNPESVPAFGGEVTVTVLVAVASVHPPVPTTV